MDIHYLIIYIHNSIKDIHNYLFVMQLWISVTEYYWIIDTQNRVLDIYSIPDWFMDNRDRRMDIYN